MALFEMAEKKNLLMQNGSLAMRLVTLETLEYK